MKYDRLKTFRQDTYSMLGKAHDATDELSLIKFEGLYAPSLGWKKGTKRTKRKTFPLAKKTHSSPKKSKNKVA